MKILVKGIVCLIMIMIAQYTHGQYNEKYRPQYHFSPKKGWIGDPDGLVFTNGQYHLFWWGHAVSRDLVRWKELPYPMRGGDGSFSYFSGSVVVDKKNTAGFGSNSMIAFYTKHLPGDTLPETQAISVSNDGIYFDYYSKNPVLDIGKIFFRDPQVFWHQPDQKWKMVVALSAEQKIHIYESADAKKWTFCSEFGGMGARSAFWECPDLFEVRLKDNPSQKKWVMMVGRGPNRVQYFAGDFDGKEFNVDPKTKSYLLAGAGIEGDVFQDFEAGMAGWVLQGNAFQHLKSGSDSSHHLGRGYISSQPKPELTGEVLSPSFKIGKAALNFLLSASNKPGQTCIELIVDGKIVRTTTGDGSTVMKWNGWDVSELAGKTATLRIKDSSTEKNSHISIDHIHFSGQLLDQQLEHALWLDYGTDFYATRTWRDIDNVSDRTVAIAWMGNWDYSRSAPTSWGKGFQSIPRLFHLKQSDGGFRMIQTPLPELQQLRTNIQQKQNIQVTSDRPLIFTPGSNVYELEVVLKPQGAKLLGLDMLVGEGRKLRLSYNPRTSLLNLDRTSCTDFTSDAKFTSAFAVQMKAPVKLQQGLLKLRVFVDQASVEVFTNDGEIVLSAVTFPSEKQLGLSVFSEGGPALLNSAKFWDLSSIWKN